MRLVPLQHSLMAEQQADQLLIVYLDSDQKAYNRINLKIKIQRTTIQWQLLAVQLEWLIRNVYESFADYEFVPDSEKKKKAWNNLNYKAAKTVSSENVAIAQRSIRYIRQMNYLGMTNSTS